MRPRDRQFPMNGPQLQAPIVLAHGALGFDKLRLGGVPLADYFRGIPALLREGGNAVPEPPQLSPTGSVEDRAQELKKYLLGNPEIAGQPVHLLAHSMGGLDARYLISCLDMAARVLTLTTIGTPHQGSAFADWVLQNQQGFLRALARLGISGEALAELTTAKCRERNRQMPDAAGVCYFSIAGQYQPGRLDVLRFPHGVIRAAEGPNDGLVSVQSATYGEYLGTWERCNHFRLINWPTNLVAPVGEFTDSLILDSYKALVRQLAKRGF